MVKKKTAKQLIEDKGLPYAEGAEAGVLSCILQYPDLQVEVTPLLAEICYSGKHKLIANAMVDLREAGDPLDLISLTSHFQAKEDAFAALGGASALSEICTTVDSPSNFAHYLSILKDKQALRSIITSCNETIEECYQNGDDVQAILGRYYQRVTQCVTDNSQSKEKSIEEATDEWMDRYEKMMKGEIQTSMPTRFTCVNKKTPIRSGYTVVMGPRKSGKSCLGFNLMTDGCLREGRPGIIDNYELSFHESMNRLVADYGNVHAAFLFEPDKCPPNRETMRAITNTISHIRKSKLQILSSRPSIEELCNKARAAHAKYGDLMVLIDYLQIAPDPKNDRKEKTREQDVAKNSALCRDLSKELNCTVIALSQINKDGTARESAAPENDCDLALRVDGEKGVLIHAQRNGPSGEYLPLFLEGEHFRFKEKQYNEVPV